MLKLFAARGTLVLGLLLAAAVDAKNPVKPPPPPGPAFVNPPFVDSDAGQISVTLESAESSITVAGQTVVSRVFNGQYIPPVFRMQQGDVLRVRQVNNLPDLPVNFHSHGLVTSPRLNGDNVFVIVDPGTEFDTEIPIPLSHQSGMFWYHPHVHPYVNQTLSHGMSSAILIGDILEPFPKLQGITERVMILKDLKIEDGEVVDDPDPAGPTLRTINGVYQPDITIAPGELQFWRIGNMGANIFYELELQGVTFHQIAVDGNLQNRMVSTRKLVIPPGGRREVLVRGPNRPGTYQLITRDFSTGPDGDQYPGQIMANVRVTGTKVTKRIPLPNRFPRLEDLRKQKPDVVRTIVFNDTDDPNVFVIDKRVWDRDRIDQTVALGSLEEWRVQNASGEFHVFHIHQGDFQVISVNGRPQRFTGYQDVVNLPIANSRGKPGEVRFRIKFDPPIIVGEYVYHCHIVQHEDQGMMANVLVEDDLARVLKKSEPPDLIASALTPALGNYWCR